MSESGQTISRGDWGWYASADEEHYTVGPFATREDVIAEAKDEELGLQHDTPGQPLIFYVIEAFQAQLTSPLSSTRALRSTPWASGSRTITATTRAPPS